MKRFVSTGIIMIVTIINLYGQIPDSLKYKTLISKRTVYGGGGIMPDVFVAADTSDYTDYYRSLIRKNIFSLFVLEYADKNRTRISTDFKTFEDYMSRFEFSPADIQAVIKKGEEAGIKYDEAQFRRSENDMLTYMKALVASNLWQTNEYFRIMNQNDIVVEKALKLINDPAEYNRILGYK